MTALTVRLNQFDKAMLDDLVEKTGESKTALVIDGLRSLHSALLDDERATYLPEKEFNDFLDQLTEGEKDPRILSARRRLLNLKPVWEE